MALHFYDDTILLGFSWEKGGAQYCYRQMQLLLGTLLDPKKSQRMSSEPSYIGVLLDLSNLLSGGVLRILPKEGRVEGILKKIDDIFAEDSLSPAEASSLMGKLNFLSSHAAGKLLRGSLSALAQRAHDRSTRQLLPVLSSALQFARLLLHKFPVKSITYGKAKLPIVHYWTDAMWEPPAPAGVGFFLYVPGLQPICGMATVPTGLLAQLLDRKQQIGQVEALACLLGPHNYPVHFRSRDVIHYIDNTSALSGCIAGGSRVADSNCIFQLHSLKLAELGCR